MNIFIESKKDTKGKVQLTFAENKIKAKLNVPLEGVPFVDGRYLAGEAEINLTCDNGDLNITIDSYEVNGKPVPEEYMKELRKENIAKRLYENPKAGPFVKRLKTVKMKDNKLFIEVKPK